MNTGKSIVNMGITDRIGNNAASVSNVIGEQSDLTLIADKKLEARLSCRLQ